MKPFVIVIEDSLQQKNAEKFALAHGFVLAKNHERVDTCLVFGYDAIRLDILEGKKYISVVADFVSGSAAHRRQFGGGKGQDIAKAVGLSKGFFPHVLDATAGLGRDAFVLASLGATVTMVERSPIVHILLQDALARAHAFAKNEADEELLAILARLHLFENESAETLTSDVNGFDVVYLDPMFPERKKSALVKKEMRAFHEIVGADEDADGLLPLALDKANYRVVVKRPRIAPDLNNTAPNYRLEGKSSRWDIYTKKAFPV